MQLTLMNRERVCQYKIIMTNGGMPATGLLQFMVDVHFSNNLHTFYSHVTKIKLNTKRIYMTPFLAWLVWKPIVQTLALFAKKVWTVLSTDDIYTSSSTSSSIVSSFVPSAITQPFLSYRLQILHGSSYG